jgi:hypothetical protein
MFNLAQLECRDAAWMMLAGNIDRAEKHLAQARRFLELARSTRKEFN